MVYLYGGYIVGLMGTHQAHYELMTRDFSLMLRWKSYLKPQALPVPAVAIALSVFSGVILGDAFPGRAELPAVVTDISVVAEPNELNLDALDSGEPASPVPDLLETLPAPSEMPSGTAEDDIPEEILRTEIITEARSPLTGEPLTAAEYAQLQAELADPGGTPLIREDLRYLVFLLQLRRALRPLVPFF